MKFEFTRVFYKNDRIIYKGHHFTQDLDIENPPKPEELEESAEVPLSLFPEYSASIFEKGVFRTTPRLLPEAPKYVRL